MKNRILRNVALGLAATALIAGPVLAHRLRSAGETVEVADSRMKVTPNRDWNRLSEEPGRRTEVWTLDGPQLNDLTFYGGIEAGRPLVRERSRRRDPLPHFERSTLLIEIPELLEGTYRTYKHSASFELTSTDPTRFLEHDGVKFTYEFADEDGLTRKGEAVAAIIGGKLYMITFDAPRLHYFDHSIDDVRALVASATL